MTVKEYMKGLVESENKAIIKVGTEHGSGFLFVGTADEFMDNITSIDRAIKKKTENALHSKALRLLKMITDPELKREVEGYVLFWKKIPSGLCKKLVYKGRWVDDYEKSRKRKKQLTKISERRIVNASASSLSSNVIIIVEGYECGRYWDLKERVAKGIPFGIIFSNGR